MIPEYVAALCNEIRISGEMAKDYFGEMPEVQTIFFGGGTPSLLSISQLTDILGEIDRVFRILPGAEITLEANPGTVDLAFLQGLSALGVNRLSLGMQSAQPEDLRILERQHSLDDVIRAVHWSRQAGFENINLDLIFGIPHQSFDSWQQTLSMALSLKPEHLALYSLTLEHGTPMEKWVARGLMPEPDSDLAADMYEHAMQRLELSGYTHYEISNWARTDHYASPFACRHNLQYWRMLPYLGFGAGAHGFTAGYRTANVLSPAAYSQRFSSSTASSLSFPSTPATAELIAIDRQMEIGEVMMMGLRLVEEGVREFTFLQRFGQTLEQVFEKQISKLIHMGLLEWNNDLPGERALRLTKAGRLLGNRAFREFI